MPSTTVHIVKAADVPWQEVSHGDHFTSTSRQLTKGMQLGANIERIAPGKVTCPFHFHVRDDEFFLVLRGRAMLRTDAGTVEIVEGDAISCPAGEGSAHQLYNHTQDPTEILMVGRNDPDDVVFYPDSEKWLVRSIRKVGRFTVTDYWDGEPDPPRLKR